MFDPIARPLRVEIEYDDGLTVVYEGRRLETVYQAYAQMAAVYAKALQQARLAALQQQPPARPPQPSPEGPQSLLEAIQLKPPAKPE